MELDSYTTGYPTVDIELALTNAEALLLLAPPDQTQAGEQQTHASEHIGQSHAAETAAGSGGGGDPPAQPAHEPRAQTDFWVRLRLHELELEMLELQAANQGLLQDLHEAEGAAAQQQRRAELAEEQALANQATFAQLTAQLDAFRGATPDEVAALHQQNGSLSKEKAALEQHAAELSRALEQQLQRLADGIKCWQRTQAELQEENQRLAGELQRRSAAQAELQQERRLLAAKVAMLEARPVLHAKGGTQTQVASAALADIPELASLWHPALCPAAAAKENDGELTARCRKYKQAVRALKERLAEREQQHAGAVQQLDCTSREQEQRIAHLETELEAAHERLRQQEGQGAAAERRTEELSGAMECERQSSEAEIRRLQEAAAQAGSQAKSAALQVLVRAQLL